MLSDRGKGMKKAIMSILIVWMLVCSVFIGLIDLGNIGNVEAPYIPHNPIRINSDTEFASMAGIEGWTGNGLPGNPYIIEGYDINGSGYGYCIYIGNTTDYFVVRDCYLHDASGVNDLPYFSNSGLTLYKVQNGTIDNNIGSNNNRYGIYLYSSSSNTIVNNSVSNNLLGIYLYSSSSNTIVNNTVSSNSNYGIFLSLSSSNNIANNIASNNDDGIYFSSSSSNNIANNTVSNNAYGIYIYASSNGNTIVNNTVSNNDQGIYLYTSCNDNTISHNNVSKNAYGIYLYTSNSNTIDNNTASSNTVYGILLSFSNSIAIHHNNFVYNTNQAKDDGSNNWNLPYPYGGNYWSDWTAPDTMSGPNQDIPGSDGIVDNPYSIDSDSIDNYPLVNPMDVIRPTITNLQPPDSFITNNDIPTIGVSYYDSSGINVSSVMLKVDSIDVTSSATVTASDVTYTPSSSLSDGNHTLYLEVEDIHGNLATASWTINIDTVPPATIIDLAASNPTETSITLTWTAPGDDGDTDFASGYIVKYSTSGPVTETNWSSAVNYSQSWIPQSAGSIESQVVSGFSSDTRYWFAIKGYDEVPNYGIISNSPDATTLASVITAPGAPRDLNVEESDSYLNLVWNPPSSDGGSSITHYNIYRNGTTGVYTSVSSGQLWYIDSNVINGVTYTYNVTAVNGIGEGSKSTGISATPKTKPSAPLNLQASSGDSYVNLSWDPPASDGGSSITNYNIYRAGSYGPLDTIPIGQSWYNDTNVINGITYTYNISAINGIGEGPKSTGFSATPKVRPSAPLDPQAASGDSYVNLSWDPPASDGGSPIINYKIYRVNSFGSLDTVSAGQFWYNDTGLVNGVTYTYNISAVNTVGEGAKASVSATPKTIPSAPQNLQISAGNNYVNLSWEIPASNGGSQVTNYAIYRGISSGEETFLAEIGAVLNYNDTSVTNNVTYYYKLRAKNAVGEGPMSNEASASPRGPEVTVPEDEDQQVWPLWLLLLVLIIIMIILFVLYKRRKKEEPPLQEPQESTEIESEQPQKQESLSPSENRQ